MSFESYKYTFRLNASHSRLNSDDTHSHTFEITLYIRQSESFSAYRETEKLISDYLDRYTNVLLNSIPPFDRVNPTLENMGEEFFAGISQVLSDVGYQLIRLTISESPQRVYSVNLDDISPEKLERLKLSKVKIGETAEISDNRTDIAETNPVSERSGLPDTIPTASSVSFTPPREIRPASGLSFFLSFLLVVFAGFAVMTAVKFSGFYPLGLDIHGHLFKSNLVYHEILKGNWYPLYTEYWYNGLQPFRYWPPMTYYVMAFLQFIAGGDVMNAYLGFIWLSCSAGGIGWLLFGRKLGRPVLGAFFGLMWFFFPDNLRVFFGEGNMPRMLITMLLPYLFYCLWNYIAYRRRRWVIPLILLMLVIIFTHLMISAMIGVASALFLLIYAIANKRWKESVLTVLAMLFSFAVMGIWVYPSLVGGLTSMASDGTSALMASLSARIYVSLNPFIRLEGGVTELYFGLSIALIAVVGVFLSNRKSLPGFVTLLIVILGTTTALTPFIQLLPLSQLFWVRRFTPIAYAFFVIAVLEWRSLKKPIAVAMCSVILFDAIPSCNLAAYDTRMNVPATISSIQTTMDTLLISEAKNITRQRVSLMDLSTLGPMPSYAFADVGSGTQYVFGWAWQGAATANNIAYLNESLEKQNYLYLFDRNLELGADTVLVQKLQLKGTGARDKLLKAAEEVGYSLIDETDDMLLFSYPVTGSFGVMTKYNGLAIGSTAALVPGILPSFHPGDKVIIDDYTPNELEQYDMIYLSGFFYRSKEDAERIVREIAKAGVKVYIDMSRIPSDPLTNRMTFLDVSAQPITFYDSFPELVTETVTTNAAPFAEGYEKWNTVYLTGLTDTEGYAWFQDTKLDFVGTDETKNITYLGFNLLFHAYTAGDSAVKAVFDSLMELDEDKLPERTVVPLEIRYETNKIVIESLFDNVNTTIAYQDTFRSDQKIRSMNNFLIVDKGTTVITMEYPYLKQGAIVTAAGIVLEAGVLYLIFRKSKTERQKAATNTAGRKEA